MKQRLFFLLGILLVVCMTMNVALADGWTCPECGAENSGNFCSNCGAKKPEPDGSVTITDVTFSYQDNGDVVVKWQDSYPASSYRVEYTTEDWDTYSTLRDISGKRAVMEYLIPGVTYQVTIIGGETEVTQEYTVPRPIYTEYEGSEEFLNLSTNTFSLSRMEKDPTMKFRVEVSYPQLKYSREYKAKLVVNTPYGYSNAVYCWDSYEFENQYTCVYTVFSMMSDFLHTVEMNFGSIPTGKYTFEMYMDGQLYGYEDFSVTR